MRHSFYWLSTIILIATVVLTAGVLAQQRPPLNRIPVETRMRGFPPYELSVVMQDSIPYVPVRSFFDFIGIQSTIDPQEQRIQGFFRSPDTTYEIRLREGTAEIEGRTMTVTPQDLFFDRESAYVRLGFINNFFGINLHFNSRRLTIDLLESDRLPGIIFQRKHSQLLRRISAQKGLPTPEVDYPRDILATGSGRLNWRVATSYTNSDAYSAPYYLNLGMKIAGGDLTLTSSGIAKPRRSTNTTRGQYRIPFPENTQLTQIVLGYLNPFPYYYGEMIGGEVTNRLLGRPRVFTREIFQGTLSPKMDIEVTESGAPPLTVTDESGMYQLDLPVPYGFGSILLRATDQFGRAQEIQYRVSTLTSMIQPGRVEYSVVMGKQNSNITTFTSSNYLSWGVNSFLTVGTRLDYFDFPSLREKLFPALTTSARLTRELTFEGFVSPLLISRFLMNWSFSDFGSLNATATKYGSAAELNPTGALSQGEIGGSFPLFSSARPVFTAFSGRITDFASYQDRTFQFGINKVFERFSFGLSTVNSWRRDFQTGETTLQNALTNLTLRLELPRVATVTTSWTYDNYRDELATIQVIATKNISRNMFINLSYFRAPNVPATSYALQVQYRFPFATASVTGQRSEEVNSYAFLGYGSVTFDANKPYVNFFGSPQPFALSGFDFNPFVDLNGDGKQESGEQSLTRARLYYGEEIKGGGLVRLPGNQLSVRNLVPYSSYIVYMDPQGIEDPTLVPKATAYRIYTESNYNRRIDIPVVVSNTLRGKVEEAKNETRTALQGIKIKLISADGKRVRETTTFTTGEYEFDFLPPGEYRVEIDQTLLTQLNLTPDEPSRNVTLGGGAEPNRIVEGIDFVLRAK